MCIGVINSFDLIVAVHNFEQTRFLIGKSKFLPSPGRDRQIVSVGLDPEGKDKVLSQVLLESIVIKTYIVIVLLRSGGKVQRVLGQIIGASIFYTKEITFCFNNVISISACVYGARRESFSENEHALVFSSIGLCKCREGHDERSEHIKNQHKAQYFA